VGIEGHQILLVMRQKKTRGEKAARHSGC
jgi:hypothetical protein